MSQLKDQKITPLVWLSIIASTFTLVDWLIRTVLALKHSPLVDLNANAALSLTIPWFWLIGIVLYNLAAFSFAEDRESLALYLSIGFAFVTNLADRIQFGGVVDYLHLFNLSLNGADVVIVTLVGARVLTLLLDWFKEMQQKRDQ